MEEWTKIFEQRDELISSDLVQLSYKHMQGYEVGNRLVSLVVLLSTNETKGQRDFSFAVPQYLIKLYQQTLIASLRHQSLTVDVMEEYQSVVGLFLRNIIVVRGEEGNPESWFFAVSENGETSYFRVPIEIALLYGIVHKLPIQAEERLLQNPMDDIDKTGEEHSPFPLSLELFLPKGESGQTIKDQISAALEKELEKRSKELGRNEFQWAQTLLRALEHENDNKEFLRSVTDEQLLHHLTRQDLSELKEKMVDMEKYEWAMRFAKLIDNLGETNGEGE